jgi:hypothetical protein
VPDRVTAFLLGDDRPDPDAVDVLEVALAPDVRAASPSLARALSDGVRFAYVREGAMSSGIATSIDSVAAVGRRSLVIDLARIARKPRPLDTVAAAIREARLIGAVLVAGPVELLAIAAPEVLGCLAAGAAAVLLVGERPWDPAWARAVPLPITALRPTSVDLRRRWQEILGPDLAGSPQWQRSVLLDATRSFHLGARQVARAADTARLLARAEDRGILPDDIQAGARLQNAAGLERLAHRVAPMSGWADLVLPTQVSTQLRELTARARQRERVLDEWRIGERSSRGRGITALFGGESGTGKTLAAEIIAGALGLDLYVIDLSTIVDKYIGETEKNLDRVFAEADRVNGVLLFDEADAIFGKRSEVRDARDRYANVEVAYLLQRMERFDGLAILTTNLRANLDDAFTRRIDVIVDFPTPEEDARLALWRMHLPPQVPQADDLDLPFLASRFRLAGGNIRNVCLTAAFLAADEAGTVAMGHLIRATEREYRKLGRLTLEAEFGPYHALLEPAPT